MLRLLTTGSSFNSVIRSASGEPDPASSVLVVEDDPWIQWMVADDLVDRAHSGLTSCDGEEALARLRKSRPNIIVDVGWEFADRYRAITGGSAIPIVVVSAARNPNLPTASRGIFA